MSFLMYISNEQELFTFDNQLCQDKYSTVSYLSDNKIIIRNNNHLAFFFVFYKMAYLLKYAKF